MRGGRAARARPSDGERPGGSAIDTARRNLLKELTRIRVDNAEALARLFASDDRVRFLYMPLFAQVVKNISVHLGDGYRGEEYVTKVDQRYLEAIVEPLMSAGKKGGRASTAEEKTLMRYRLMAAFVRYNRFATSIMERE